MDEAKVKEVATQFGIKGVPITAELYKNQKHITLGSILCCSWGYEQTNIDFYFVIGLTPSKKSAKVLKMPTKVTTKEGYSAMSHFTMPDLAVVKHWLFFTKMDTKVGKVKRILGKDTDRPYIKLSSFEYAYLWDGEEQYESWYG
jgi:hypothetical protein